MANTDFSVRDVLEWARTKPADETYDYAEPTNCALCHFLRDTGRACSPLVRPAISGIMPADWMELAPLGATHPYPEIMEPALRDSHTFGRLAQHLERLCPEARVVTKSDWARLDAYMADIELASA